MLERIRSKLMIRLQVRRELIKKHVGKLCPKIEKKLEKLKVESGGCCPMWAGEGIFQVNCSNGDQWVVNLDDRSCSCRVWDLNGIPCAHAVAAIFYKGGRPEDYVSDCYLTSTNQKIYNPIINPLNGPSMWVKTTIPPPLPPLFHKQTGRPKKVRRKEAEEIERTDKVKRRGGTVTCCKCGVLGHNSRTCKNPPDFDHQMKHQRKHINKPAPPNKSAVKSHSTSTANEDVPPGVASTQSSVVGTSSSRSALKEFPGRAIEQKGKQHVALSSLEALRNRSRNK